MTGFLPFSDPARAADQDAASSEKPKGRLFLLDGNALAYRGHFALIRSPLTTSRGENVSALYVFATTLLRILENEKPDYLAVAFDPKGKTFRHEQFEAYKATREKTPPELIAMLPEIRKLVEGFGAPILEREGYEADDVIATVAKKAEAQGLEVFIVTGDKDFLQIVSPRVKLYNVTRPDRDVEIQGVEAAESKFGVGPDKVIDVLALMGDSSDNVPGVAGIGPKGASELVRKHGSIEDIYAHLDRIEKPALRKKLEAARDEAFLSKRLIQLDLDAPVDFDPEAFRYRGPDPDRLLPLLRRFEMNSLVKRLEMAPREDRRDYESIEGTRALERLCEELRRRGAFSLSVHAEGAQPRRAKVVAIAMSAEPHRAVFVSLQTDREERIGLLRAILEDAGIEKRLHDAKSQSLALAAAGVELGGVSFDTMLASYCAAPVDFQHSLDHLATRYLSIRRTPESSVVGEGRKKVAFHDADPAAQRDFACESADLIERLHPILDRELREAGTEELFREVEMPLYRVLERMERTGIAVDVDLLRELSRDLEERANKLARRIHELAGEEFNINSPKQLGPVLFEKLEVHKQLGSRKKPRRTKTGYSTDHAVLESFREHPIVQAILEYRSLVKLKGTYADALPGLIDPETGRIHTSFNQAVAATGRLSSSDPNLQNIPVRTEEGRRIRRAFIPGEPGWVLLSADYSQVELRIMAHLSGDEKLRQAFLKGVDVHRWTAGLIFGMKPEDVPPELRSKAKAINFGVMYGMGPQRLAQETGMTPGEAQKFIDAYFKTFSGVKAFLDRTLEQAREDGYVTTLLGRKRALPDLGSSHPRVAAQARNMALNTPLQGTAADLIKVAMIRVARRIEDEGLEARMLLQVHDELLFECPKDEVGPLSDLVRDAMANAIALDVPLVVDIGVGENWLEAH